MSRRHAVIAALIVGALAGVWLAFTSVSRWWWRGGAAPAAQTPAAAAAPTGERKIKATLYYVSEDGLSLVGVEREVPFGDPIVEQARRLVEAQLAPAPAPLASAIPEGTTLRALFLGDRGDAFVDLSPEVTTRHSGGALDELFTVYAIVDTLTVNLPAITRVQILVNGKEADTLAGHVDIRGPLQKNLDWATPHAGPPTPESQGQD
ncbi:MAG: GerMN domain-containing protein [Acidobacteriota bacterium]